MAVGLIGRIAAMRRERHDAPAAAASAPDPATPEEAEEDDMSEQDGKAADKAKETKTEAAAPAAAAPPAAPAPAAVAADPATVMEYCTANGVPQLAAGLVREKATMEQVKAKVDVAGRIRAKVGLAARMGFDAAGQQQVAKLAEDYIAAGKSPEQFVEAMVEKLAAEASPEIRNTIDANAADKTAIAAVWDKAIANGRRKSVKAAAGR